MILSPRACSCKKTNAWSRGKYSAPCFAVLTCSVLISPISPLPDPVIRTTSPALAARRSAGHLLYAALPLAEQVFRLFLLAAGIFLSGDPGHRHDVSMLLRLWPSPLLLATTVLLHTTPPPGPECPRLNRRYRRIEINRGGNPDKIKQPLYHPAIITPDNSTRPHNCTGPPDAMARYNAAGYESSFSPAPTA
jgi:hypothetical protein